MTHPFHLSRRRSVAKNLLHLPQDLRRISPPARGSCRDPSRAPRNSSGADRHHRLSPSRVRAESRRDYPTILAIALGIDPMRFRTKTHNRYADGGLAQPCAAVMERVTRACRLPAGFPASAPAPCSTAASSTPAECLDAARLADHGGHDRQSLLNFARRRQRAPLPARFSVLLKPSATHSTFRERTVRACAAFRVRDQVPNCLRSSTLIERGLPAIARHRTSPPCRKRESYP